MGEVKLTDFGIARSTTQDQETEVGFIKGKPGYLAPEQAAGEELDGRVDLFALGVTLWECLAGEPLFTGVDAAATLTALFEKQVPSLRARRVDVPPAFDAFVCQLLERDLSRRTPSARIALQSLRAMESGAVGSGARALAGAIEITLRTTVSSQVNIKSHAPVSAEAPTLPGRS